MNGVENVYTSPSPPAAHQPLAEGVDKNEGGLHLQHLNTFNTPLRQNACLHRPHRRCSHVPATGRKSQKGGRCRRAPIEGQTRRRESTMRGWFHAHRLATRRSATCCRRSGTEISTKPRASWTRIQRSTGVRCGHASRRPEVRHAPLATPNPSRSCGPGNAGHVAIRASALSCANWNTTLSEQGPSSTGPAGGPQARHGRYGVWHA